MKRSLRSALLSFLLSIGSIGPLFPVSGNEPPVAEADGPFVTTDTASIVLEVLANDSDSDGDPLAVVAVRQPDHGHAFIHTRGTSSYLVFSPEPGFEGPVSFTYTASDRHGGRAEATVDVDIALQQSTATIVARRGGPVPDEEEGARFLRFGPPGLDGSEPFYRAFFLRPGSPRILQGVFGSVDGAPFKVVAGDEAPGIDGATFASFSDPVAESGFGFLARLRGPGISARNNESLWSTSLPSSPSTLTLVAREGDPAPGIPGAIYQSFISFGMNSDGRIQWLARLKPTFGGVTAANDLVLYQASESEPVIVVRERDHLVVGGVVRIVKSFRYFDAPPGSAGDARTEFGPILTVNFDDGTQGVGVYNEGSPLIFGARTGGSPIDAPAARYGTFYGNSGGALFRADFRTGLSAAPNGQGIFFSPGNEDETYRAVLSGDSILSGNAVFGKFSDPLSGGSFCFRVTVSGPGSTPQNNEFLLWAGSFQDPLIIAAERGSSYAPTGLAVVDHFIGLSVPNVEADPRGPVYFARLRGRGVTAGNRDALCAVNSAGGGELLARTGALLAIEGTPKRLAQIGAFIRVPRSPTQRRTVGAENNVIYRAVFTDDTQAIVTVHVP